MAHEPRSTGGTLSLLGEQVASVAHELNNPLHAVLGFAELLLGEELSAAQQVKVGHIVTHARRCQRIVGELLGQARNDPSRRQLANLNDVARSSVELTEYPTGRAAIRIVTDLDPALPDSRIDPFHLQQVVINLLTNAEQAITASRRVGVITIRTRRSVEGNALLEVADDGCGMDDAVLARIFDPFFTTKAVGVGTGLGLALASRIVREHGGTLTASSRVSEGSTFRIELPGERLADPIARSRILVVDDEPALLELMAQLLAIDGHAVTTAASVDAALRAIAGASFDLVITDWRLPGGMAGGLHHELCERRAAFRGRVVVMTGDLLGGDVQQAAGRYGNAVLRKPCTLDSIRRAIGTICRPVEPLPEAQLATPSERL